MKGIYFEKGPMIGCTILLPKKRVKSFSIGTSSIDSPDLLVECSEYFYLCVGNEFSPGGLTKRHQYGIIIDAEGPIVEAQSGMTFNYGDVSIRLL